MVARTLAHYKKCNDNVDCPFEYILDEIPKTIRTMICGWRCKTCKNIKDTTFRTIYDRKTKCLYCPKEESDTDKKGTNKKKTLEDYRIINTDSKRKIEYILDHIPQTAGVWEEKGWKCCVKKCGYVWGATYSNIHAKNNPTGCPKCAGNIKKTLKEYQIINTNPDRKIEYILDYIPQNIHVYEEKGWKCCVEKCGHIWAARYDDIYNNGHGCPNCCFKNEAICREIMEELFCIKFDKVRPKFLEGLELDGYHQGFGIGFEYNGIQHTKFTPHFHRNGEKDLTEQQERDQRKYRLCKENNVFLIIIDHKLNTREKIREFLEDERTNYLLLTYNPDTELYE